MEILKLLRSVLLRGWFLIESSCSLEREREREREREKRGDGVIIISCELNALIASFWANLGEKMIRLHAKKSFRKVLI